MLAKDIMRKKVITVHPETTIQELAQLFVDRHITGAPVVDGKGALVGVVSQTDLVRHDRDAPNNEIPSYHMQPEEGIRSQGFHLENPDMTRVLDIMTPAVISFEETTSIRDLAKEMLKKRIHRVPITRRGQLCGIVTSIDLLRALLELIERHPGAFRLPLEKVAG